MRNTVVTLICALALACGGPKSPSTEKESVQEEETRPDSTDPAPVKIPETADPAPDEQAEAVIPVPENGPEEIDPDPLLQKLYDPGKTGPLTVRSYSTGLTNAAYQSALVFYPVDSTRTSFPATTLSGGYTNTKEMMVWLARHLASHGIITLVFTPTNRMSLNPNIWSVGHLGALDQLELENKRRGSPIEGRVNVQRLGVMGFSMGGAGAALAVNKAGPRVKAAVLLCPYQPAVLTAPVSMLSITGTRDTVASPASVERAFKSSKAGRPKAFARFNGMTHQDVAIGGSHHDDIARYASAWYRVFLADESAYQTYLNGAELAKQRAGTTVFARPGDYIYEGVSVE